MGMSFYVESCLGIVIKQSEESLFSEDFEIPEEFESEGEEYYFEYLLEQIIGDNDYLKDKWEIHYFGVGDYSGLILGIIGTHKMESYGEPFIVSNTFNLHDYNRLTELQNVLARMELKSLGKAGHLCFGFYSW